MKPLREILRDLRAHHLLEPAKQIADRHHVELTQILGRRRHAPIAAARHELWSFAYEMLPSYPMLGEIFDRDHTSIRSGVLVHRDRRTLAEAVRADAQLSLWSYTAPRTGT